MVFRNGGIIRNNEKWWIMGTQLKLCTCYKYLGLNLSTRGTWQKATKTLSPQTSKALFILTKIKKKHL